MYACSHVVVAAYLELILIYHTAYIYIYIQLYISYMIQQHDRILDTAQYMIAIDDDVDDDDDDDDDYRP